MEKAIELLENYQDFLQVKPAGTMQEFGAWLQRNPEEVELDQPELNKQKLNIKFAYTLSKLSSFLDAWVKLSFRDIPLRSLGDFGILMSIRFMQNPRKTDVAEQVIMERSTCMESIKRLIGEDLVEQSKDTADRRVWRVQLTKSGFAMCEILDEKMKSLGDLVAGEISDEEKLDAIAPLAKLVDFHQNLYSGLEGEKIITDFRL